jgi:hypothetical protein
LVGRAGNVGVLAVPLLFHPGLTFLAISSSCGNNFGVAATPNKRYAIAARAKPCASSPPYAMSASRNASAMASTSFFFVLSVPRFLLLVSYFRQLEPIIARPRNSRFELFISQALNGALRMQFLEHLDSIVC